MFVLMVFSLFYLLKDGEKWKNGLINIFPLSDNNTNIILMDLKKSINKIFKGSFIIAIAQGILAWIGLTVFGVPNAIIWAVVAAVASFVPTIGTSVVTVPAILFLFFTGMQLQALGLLLWSILLVGMIDNVLSPYIISKDTAIPSLFILFSILGAISLVGPLGILIGPLVLSLLYSLISIYKKELKN
jgi:predicted PurR-regulated permease PerM